MSKPLVWAAALAALFAGLGCSGADPSDALGEPVNDSVAALRDDADTPNAKEVDTALVALSDGTIHQLSASGADLGIFTEGLNQPTALALDKKGNVYVANVGDDTVRMFSASGGALGVFASAAMGLNEPVALAFDADGNLFVANIGDNSIVRFAGAGRPLRLVLSLLGRGCPSGLAFSPKGHLLVADQCASVIREVLPNGGELGTFAAGGISSPSALVFDTGGDLFVANTAGAFGNTVRQFSDLGRELGVFSNRGLSFPVALGCYEQAELLVANGAQRPGGVDYAIHRFSLDGHDSSEFAVLPAQPRGLLVRSTKH